MIAVLILACIFLVWQLFGKGTVDTSTMSKQTASSPTSSATEPPSMTIDPSKSYEATVTTDKGTVVIALEAKAAPNTVNNFVYLAKKGFYNGTIFHRVVKDFMIQGGDPTGTGSGGPGYKFADENLGGSYTRGTVAMANSGPNTNGSQFFIMHKDMDIDKLYVIFGKVTTGMDVVDAIATATVHAGVSGEDSTPDLPVHITAIDITVK